MPLVVRTQRTEAWLKAREGRITASLAASCLGIDKHRSPIAAWKQITGQGKEKDNGFMRWGREQEAGALRIYERKAGRIVKLTGFWVHAKYPWLGASPDGLVGKDGQVEVKCPMKLPTEIPEPHKLQMLVGLAVTDRQWCDYFAWVKSGETFLERFERPAMFDETTTLMKLFAWWTEFVQGDKKPPKRWRINRKKL